MIKRDDVLPRNGLELQAARKLLMMDASEAATEIGKVSARSWQYWEAGRYEVPADVKIEIEALLEVRLERMTAIDAKLEQLKDGEVLQLKYYMSFEQYLADFPDATKTLWRIDQSIAALYYTEGLAELV